MRLLILLLSLILVAPAWAAPTIIPLEDYLGGQTTIRAQVDGHEGLFLFDTGQGVSSIMPAFAAKIGCKPWGRVTGFRMTGEREDFPRCDGVRFTTQAGDFTAPIAGVFDIDQYLPKDAPVDGSLGLDVFAGRVVTIEPVARRLVIETPESLAVRIKNAREIPARLVRDAEGVALSVDAAVPTPRGYAWMELDTGNGGTLAIATHIAPLLGMERDRKEPQPASFSLGGGIRVSGAARVLDLIMDGNIGNRVLRDYNLTLDLAQGRAWMAPAD
jgi:hypothetical protein